MDYLISIVGLGVICGLWYVTQKATGRLPDDDDGGCSTCTGGKSSCSSNPRSVSESSYKPNAESAVLSAIPEVKGMVTLSGDRR